MSSPYSRVADLEGASLLTKNMQVRSLPLEPSQNGVA